MYAWYRERDGDFFVRLLDGHFCLFNLFGNKSDKKNHETFIVLDFIGRFFVLGWNWSLSFCGNISHLLG